jgi:hypothetical protein
MIGNVSAIIDNPEQDYSGLMAHSARAFLVTRGFELLHSTASAKSEIAGIETDLMSEIRKFVDQ